MLRIFPVILACTSLFAADPWTKCQVAMEVGYQLALICDWKQTTGFQRTWGASPSGGVIVEEANPLLGRRPSRATINNWCIISALGHVAVSHYLSTKWRTRWQSATMTIEIAVVAHNQAMAGVYLRF
jgi:hypothetical protein